MQVAYLGLKGLNLVSATALNFLLVFVLIRRLPIEGYSTFILASAIGVYVLATDLGVTSLVYVRIREAFLREETGTARAFALVVLIFYAVIVTVAATVFALASGPVKLTPAGMEATFSLYFLSMLLALPWGVVRAIANGSDQFLSFEAVEACRRLGLLALAVAMMGGLSFFGYAAGSLLLWILAYALTLPPLLKILGPGGLPSWKDWRDLFNGNTRQLGAVGLFSSLEFAIYNFPYLLVPLLYGKGWSLVAFDVFYKITRFGAAGYLAVNEGLLPAATRAIHMGDAGGIRRHLVLSLALSAVACATGAIAVTIFGDLVFGLLLHDASRAPHALRACMAATLLAMMFQACAGVLMINTGKGPVLARIATGIGAAMAILAVVAAFGIGFERFMIAYTVLFACGAAVYFVVLTRTVRRVSSGGSW